MMTKDGQAIVSSYVSHERNFLDGAESAPKPEKRPQTPRETRQIEAEKQACFWHFWGKPKSMPISRVRFDA